MIAAIDEARGLESRATFIRATLAASLSTTPEPVKPKSEKVTASTAPLPPTADEFAIVSALIDPDPSYWRAYAKPYGGIDVEFFAHLTTMPIFMDGLAEHRAQKTPR